jgi:hypothetical protein
LRGVLIHREHLLQQGGKLGFAKNTARFDIGQQVLQITHALRQRLHFAQATVNLLKPVCHLLEAFAQPRFQRALQLFIDRLAHLVELGRIGLLQLGELLFECLAHFGHAAGIGFADRLQLHRERVRQRFLQQRQLLAERVDLRILRANGFGALLRQRLLKGGKGAGQLLAAAACVLADLATYFTLNLVIACRQGGQNFSAPAVRRFAQQQPYEQQKIKQQQTRRDPEFHEGCH